MGQLIFLAVGLVVAGSYAARFADLAVEARPESQAAILETANDLREPTVRSQPDARKRPPRVEGRFFVDGLGPARRGAVEESARRLVSVTAQALRIRQRAPAARAVIGTLEIGGGALSAPPALGYWICAL